MSVVDIIDRVLGMGGSDIQLKVIECGECGEQFESAKQIERASCPECLANDVEQVGTAER